MLYQLKKLLGNRNLLLQKRHNRRLRLLCQQSYPGLNDVNCRIHRDENCNKNIFVSNLFSKKQILEFEKII